MFFRGLRLFAAKQQIRLRGAAIAASGNTPRCRAMFSRRLRRPAALVRRMRAYARLYCLYSYSKSDDFRPGRIDFCVSESAWINMQIGNCGVESDAREARKISPMRAKARKARVCSDLPPACRRQARQGEHSAASRAYCPSGNSAANSKEIYRLGKPRMSSLSNPLAASAAVSLGTGRAARRSPRVAKRSLTS